MDLKFYSIVLLIIFYSNQAFSSHGKELAVFGVNKFDSRCGGGDLNWSDEFIDKVKDRFEKKSWSVDRRLDRAVDGEDWADSSKVTWGNDSSSYGVDSADVGLLSSHGVCKTSSAGDAYSRFSMGDESHSTDECKISTHDEMSLGNGSAGDLEVIVFATCQGGQYETWRAGGYKKAVTNTSSLNTWLGFHGNSWDSKKDSNSIKKWAKNSFNDGLGDNWLDEMYRSKVYARDDDGHIKGPYEQCPTSIIFCESYDKCDKQHNWGGFDDRLKVAKSDIKNKSKIYYFKNCDPSGTGPTP